MRPVIFSDSYRIWLIRPLAALHSKKQFHKICFDHDKVLEDSKTEKKIKIVHWAVTYSSFIFCIFSGSVSCIFFLNCCLTMVTKSSVLCFWITKGWFSLLLQKTFSQLQGGSNGKFSDKKICIPDAQYTSPSVSIHDITTAWKKRENSKQKKKSFFLISYDFVCFIHDKFS